MSGAKQEPAAISPQHPFVRNTAGLTSSHCLRPLQILLRVLQRLVVIPIHKPREPPTISRHHLGSCRSTHSRGQGTLSLVPSSMPSAQQELFNCHISTGLREGLRKVEREQEDVG